MSDTLRARVFRALDNAVENGYETEILNQSLQETAADLADCDADLEGVDTETLGPLVGAWLRSKGHIS